MLNKNILFNNIKNDDMLDNPDDPRSCVCFLLSRAAQAAQKRLRHLLQPYGLTPQQYLIVECLWHWDKLSPKEIGELLKFDSAPLTGLIDRLARGGFVVREPNPDDRRAIRICLTEKSYEKKDELRKLRVQANEEVMSLFSAGERRTFKEALVSLISMEDIIDVN